MSIEIGSRAVPFTLASKPGNPVDVGALIGKEKFVLLFIPLAFSSVCTAAMCHVRDNWDEWQKLGCRCFAISVDSPFTVAKFAELERLPFPVLSDFNKDVSRSWGALHEELNGLKGVSKRAAFVVDASGKVAYAWVSENPGVQVDFAALDRAVKSC